MSVAGSATVYLTFVLGGLAVYFLMPSSQRSRKVAGVILGLGGFAGAMMLCASEYLAPRGLHLFFYPSAAVALVSAVKVITHEKPVYSALYFVLTVLSIAPLLVLQDAEFLAAALVIIYAGAILVTYVFVIMLAQQGTQQGYDRRAREPFLAVFAGFVTMAVVAGQIAVLPERWTAQGVLVSERGDPETTVSSAQDNTTAIGEALVTQYVVALELAGVLLLVAMIGAVAVSRKRAPAEDGGDVLQVPGQAGRNAAPF